MAVSPVLDTIKAFVAGEMTPAQFREHLYAAPEFEELLRNDPHLKPDNYVKGSAYHFLLDLDFEDPGDVLNAQGALTDFMDRNGIPYRKTSRYEDFCDLVVSACPRWLLVQPKYVQDQILPSAGDRAGDELKEWLHEELLKRFRFVSAPPEWIQSPEWPIGEHGPLVFLGRLDVNFYFHDAASVYVFHDPESGNCETVIQVY